MVDPFDTLGIEARFDVDLGAVEKRHRELSRVLHPDRHVASAAAERRMALSRAIEVNEAWRVVRDPIRRAEALLARRGAPVREGEEPRPDGALLLEVMELREGLAEARAARDAARVEALAASVRAAERDTLGKLAAAFASDAEAAAVLPLVGRLRYFRRFLDEVSVIEDDLAGLPPAGATA